MKIQNNPSSLNAYNRLNVNISGLSDTTEKLASGYRINRAGDDAAGLAVSEKMRSQIRGLEQGTRNMQDGINLLQTTDGALSTVDDMVHRLSELSEQAANGSYSDIERQAIQQEVDQILEEIDQTAEYVTFNNKTLFGGESKSAAAAAASSGGNIQQPQTRNVMERNNAAMSALLEDVFEDMDFTPLMAMSEDVLKVRAYAAAPQADNVTQCGDLTVTGGVEGVDFKYENNTLSILTDTAVEISGTSTKDKIFVNSGVNAEITLNNLNLSTKVLTAVLFTIADDSKGNVHLTLKGDNSLICEAKESYLYGNMALMKNGGVDSGTLTIDGSGSLTTNSKGGAGIGSFLGSGTSKNNSISCDNITISGGTIKAVGEKGPGIGSGNVDNGEIVIRGNSTVVYAVAKTKTDYMDRKCDNIGSFGGKITVNRYSGLIIEDTEGYIYGGNVTIKDDFTIEKGVYVHVDGERSNSHSLTIDKGVTLTNDGTMHVYLNDKLPINGTVVNNGLIIYEGEDDKPDESKIKGGGKIEKKDPDTPEPDKPENPVDPNPVDPNPPGGGDDPDPPGGGGGGDGEDPKPVNPNPPGGGNTDPVNPNPPGGNGGNGGGNGSNGGGTGFVSTGGENVWWIQYGARSGDGMLIEIGHMNAQALGIDGLNVSTIENANRSIDMTAAALDKVSYIRSTIGAQQNRLEHKITNVINTNANLTEAESAIRDTDMAEEMIHNTKYKILMQASQLMLMQSNEVPQSVLQLLG